MTVPYSEAWRDQAACLGYPIRGDDPWFIEDHPRGSAHSPGVRRRKRRAARTALAFCRICPVTAACLDYAIEVEGAYAERFGIYGGTTPLDRKNLARRRRDRPVTVRQNSTGAEKEVS